jgi:hypothetical protein
LHGKHPTGDTLVFTPMFTSLIQEQSPVKQPVARIHCASFKERKDDKEQRNMIKLLHIYFAEGLHLLK